MTENLLTQRAESRLFEAVGKAETTVVLVSPFLSMRVAQRLARVAKSSSAEWSLLTHLDPLAAAGRFLSIGGLRELYEAGVKLGHIDSLHAKVYIADEFTMVGSANLTNTGLGATKHHNVELTVELMGDAVAEVRKIVGTWWDSARPIDLGTLADLEARMRALPRVVLAPSSIESEPQQEVSAKLLAELIADARERTLWVKAQFGEPTPEQWLETHWFSSSKRGRPSFECGDLVLMYSKDAHANYAIVEVLDSAIYAPELVVGYGYPQADGDRWPWVNTTKPRLVPLDGTLVFPEELGFTGQGLQGGHRRIGVAEFVDAVHALAGEPGT